MRLFVACWILIATTAASALAGAPAAGPSLFERLTGRWLLHGTIAGRETTHDVDADLVLNGGYVRLHEVSREKDSTGAPAYEAMVFVSQDAGGEYRCLWLDTTGNGGLSAAAVGHAKATSSRIPFVFGLGAGDTLRNTFAWQPESDTWTWAIDDESGGKVQPFARVTLTRK